MDVTALRSLLAKDVDGNSTILRRSVRRLGTVLHHGLLSLTLGLEAQTDKFEDQCAIHKGTEAPPSPYRLERGPSLDNIDTEAYPNPVLTAADVTDYGRIDYVADPFLVLGPDEWQLYFEVFNPDRDPTAVIGRATSRDRGLTWDYDSVVLNPGVHVSFPYVFKWEGDVWMLPNLDPEDEISPVYLYRSSDGGLSFERYARVLDPEITATDRVVFRWDGRWWLFVSLAGDQRELRIYHSDDLASSDWYAHDRNPVAVDLPRIPGGRPVITDSGVVAFFQNGPDYYGNVVEAYEITDLTTSDYADTKLCTEPVAQATGSLFGWNSGRMHTFDPWYTGDRWVCAVDGDIGFGRSVLTPHWSIGIYSIPHHRSGD